MVEVILKTSAKAHNTTRITGLILIIVGFIIQLSPIKEKEQANEGGNLNLHENNNEQIKAQSEISSNSQTNNTEIETVTTQPKQDVTIHNISERKNFEQISVPNSLNDCFSLITNESIKEDSKNDLKISLINRFIDGKVEVVKYNNNLPTPDGTIIEDYIESIINSGKKVKILSTEKRGNKISKLNVEEL